MIIVSDASPLIGLGRINQLELLNELFNQVIIPNAVANECTEHIHKPGAKAIQQAIDNKLIILHKKSFKLIGSFSKVLGQGEIEAISLATKLSAPLLIDERKGRIAAKLNKVNVIGIGGILIAAKQEKLVPDVAPLLKKLRDTGYRFSDKLYYEILNRTQENA